MNTIDSPAVHVSWTDVAPHAPVDGAAASATSPPNRAVTPSSLPAASRETLPGADVAALPAPVEGALSTGAGAALQRALSANADAATLGVDITQLIATMTRFAQELRDSRSQDRTAALNTQMRSLAQGANEIREAAAKNFTAAIIQGAVQIGGGVMQGAGGLTALRSTKGSIDAGTESDAGRWLAARANTQMTTGKSLGDGLGGIGAIAASHWTRDARNHEADQAQDEAMAKRSEAGAGAAGDTVAKMEQVIVGLREMSRSMNQARSDTAAAVIRNV